MAAVTVWLPALSDRHSAPVHEPPAASSAAVPVTSPSGLPKASKPVTVNSCGVPALTVATGGAISSRLIGPAITVNGGESLFGPSTMETVWGPATVAVQ